MSRTITLVAAIALIAMCSRTHAAQHDWNTAVPGAGPFSLFDAGNWVGSVGGVPINGNSVDLEVDNVQRTYDINNGGAGFTLPNSTIDIGRGVYLDSAGADDAIVGDVIRINGAGGSAPTFNVPVIANTFTSNRHGGVFNAAITVDTILANSAHQDRWQINVSPTKKLVFLDLDENRGADGGNIDGFFAVNADTEIATVEHTWSNLRVGAGATLIVDTYNYSDYTNKASDNNINPITLDGTLLVSDFIIFDVQNQTSSALGFGTYGALGNFNADNQVAFITGNGLLSVGTAVPEPASALLAVMGIGGMMMRRRRSSAAIA